MNFPFLRFWRCGKQLTLNPSAEFMPRSSGKCGFPSVPIFSEAHHILRWKRQSSTTYCRLRSCSYAHHRLLCRHVSIGQCARTSPILWTLFSNFRAEGSNRKCRFIALPEAFQRCFKFLSWIWGIKERILVVLEQSCLSSLEGRLTLTLKWHKNQGTE